MRQVHNSANNNNYDEDNNHNDHNHYNSNNHDLKMHVTSNIII